MAVLTTPKLLLLDEHTAALDPKTADVVMQATTQAVARDRLTTLMVTHNMQHALDYGNRLIMMNEGRIVFEARDGEKAALTVDRLVHRFHLASDRMLLG
jgi:putative ABC transport system ATP-binding protein